MTLKNFFKLLLENRCVVILLSLPLCVVCISLFGLCNERISMYIFNCHIELIALILLWILFWSLVLIWCKLKQCHPINYAIFVVLVTISVVVSFPFVKDIAKGRYVYYKYGLFTMSHKDVEHMTAAIDAFNNKKWKLAKLHLDSCNKNCNKFFSYSRKKIYSKLERIETSKNSFSKLLENYDLTPSMLKLYESLANDFGGNLLEDYSYTRDSVLNIINNIEKLYEAISCNDLDLCLNLISTYGLYWFEPEMKVIVINSQDPIQTLQSVVMKNDNGKQYKQNLKNVWGLQ